MLAGLYEVSHYAFNPYAVPVFVTALAVTALGLYTILRERMNSVNLTFSILSFLLSFWLFTFSFMYCSNDSYIAFIWSKIVYVAIPFIPAAILHFPYSILKTSIREWYGVVGGFLPCSPYCL